MKMKIVFFCELTKHLQMGTHTVRNVEQKIEID